MSTTDDEIRRLGNMFYKIKYIVFKIKILTVLLLCCSFGNSKFCVPNKETILFRDKRSFTRAANSRTSQFLFSRYLMEYQDVKLLK